jgi:hypothetical protein
MIDDALQNMAKIEFRIKPVELGSTEQCYRSSSAFAIGVRTSSFSSAVRRIPFSGCSPIPTPVVSLTPDFFARFNPTTLLGEPLELAFLDGMHRCEYLLRDFLNTERHCRPNSVIALHDCLPLEAPMADRSPNAAAIDPLRQGMWTGDVWRTALLLKRRRPDLRMVVLDAAPTGLVLITNLDPQNNMLAESEDQFIGEMMSWSLEEITLAGYYKEIGVESEIDLRQPEQIRARLHSQPEFIAQHYKENIPIRTGLEQR